MKYFLSLVFVSVVYCLIGQTNNLLTNKKYFDEVSKFIDIYSYQLNLARNGKYYFANPDIDQAIYLCDPKRNIGIEFISQYQVLNGLKK